MDGTISLDLTRDLHRLIAVDICDDAYDGRVVLLSALFGKKDLSNEMSLHKDRSGTAGAGFIPPASGNLRLVVLRTLFPLTRHSMTATGLTLLTSWLLSMQCEEHRLRLLLSIVPMYHWASSPAVVAQLITFLKEKVHAALLLAVIAAQVGPFCARSELVNSVCRCGVHLNVIQSAAVTLGTMAKVDSSNLNGRYSLTLTNAMDSFLLRIIIHRDCFVSHTLSQRHLAANRSPSRAEQRTRPASSPPVEYPPMCLDTLVLPPKNEELEVPQLSSFAYGILQQQILSLISDDSKLQRALQTLNDHFPQNTGAANGASIVAASGLEKLVESRFCLLNNAAVVAFAIKCTSSVKVGSDFNLKDLN